MTRSRRSIAPLGIVLACALLAPGAARADEPAAAAVIEERWALRASVAAGLMISADQRDALALDGGGGVLRLAGSARPFGGLDWLEGELSLGGLLVGPGRGGRPGASMDVLLSARFSPRVEGVRVIGALGFGIALTGPYVRPAALASIGVGIPLGDELSLVPEVSLLHVMQLDGAGQSDDALFLSAGLGLTWRPVSRVVTAEPEPEPVVSAPPPRTYEPLPPPPPVRMEEIFTLIDRAVPGSTLRVVMLVPPVLFEHGESALTAAGEVAMHDVLERVSEADASARIVIEGHADMTGDAALNLALSERRAEVVADWLVQRGVPRARMVLRGEGTLRPLVEGSSEDVATLAPNRRVTIRIETDMPVPEVSPEGVSPEGVSPEGVLSPEGVMSPEGVLSPEGVTPEDAHLTEAP